MPTGNFAHGDYFIDIDPRFAATSRALLGVWINIMAAIITFSIRTFYKSRAKNRLHEKQVFQESFDLWRIILPTAIGEVWELRKLLLRCIAKRYLFYLLTSLTCIAAAIVSAASTAITNYSIVSNTAVRPKAVPGRLAFHVAGSVSGVDANVTSHIMALDKANAPVEGFFDFVPEDTSGWVFVEQEWNNTWNGTCNYSTYVGVDFTLNVDPSILTFPLVLENYIPQWVNRTALGNQSFVYSANNNADGSYRDLIGYYLFGSTEGLISSADTTNISLVNFYGHNVVIGSPFKANIELADCKFDNVKPGYYDQASVDLSQGIPSEYALDAVINVRNIPSVICANRLNQVFHSHILIFCRAHLPNKSFSPQPVSGCFVHCKHM